MPKNQLNKAGICSLFVTLIACSSISLDAWACTTGAWRAGSSGSIASSGKPSVGGACALEVTGTGFVQDNTPLNEFRFIGRFYFFPQFSGSGTTDIFVAYSDESATELFSVKYDGSGIAVAINATSIISTYIPVTSNRWHLIEFAWQAGSVGSLWVDADARSEPASTTFTSGNGTVDSVRLGAPNGFGGLTGMAYFDDYVSHNSQPIGGVLPGDANGDGAYGQPDINAIIQEFLNGTYSDGVTDCNLDGEVNSGDINCVVAESGS